MDIRIVDSIPPHDRRKSEYQHYTSYSAPRNVGYKDIVLRFIDSGKDSVEITYNLDAFNPQTIVSGLRKSIRDNINHKKHIIKVMRRGCHVFLVKADKTIDYQTNHYKDTIEKSLATLYAETEHRIILIPHSGDNAFMRKMYKHANYLRYKNKWTHDITCEFSERGIHLTRRKVRIPR